MERVPTGLPFELPHDGAGRHFVDHRNQWGVGEVHPSVVLLRVDLACSTPVSANDNHAIVAFEYCTMA